MQTNFSYTNRMIKIYTQTIIISWVFYTHIVPRRRQWRVSVSPTRQLTGIILFLFVFMPRENLAERIYNFIVFARDIKKIVTRSVEHYNFRRTNIALIPWRWCSVILTCVFRGCATNWIGHKKKRLNFHVLVSLVFY